MKIGYRFSFQRSVSQTAEDSIQRHEPKVDDGAHKIYYFSKQKCMRSTEPPMEEKIPVGLVSSSVCENKNYPG